MLGGWGRKAAVGLIGAFLSLALSPAAAREIGPRLTVYTAPAVAALFDALVAPFAELTNRKYGVPVQVQVVTTSVPAAWTALKTEWPNPRGDVYMLYGENIREGIGKGYFEPLRPHYDDAEWRRFDAGALEAMATQGYAAPFIMTAIVLAVQGSVPEDAVTAWADLEGETLRRRFTFESALSVGSGYNVAAAAALAEGADWHAWFKADGFDEKAARPTLERMRRWADNALTLTQGSGTIRPLLARGDALAATWWWANAVQEIRNGMDLRIVYPREGTVTAVQAGPVVMSVAKNPVAAIEWVKFVHSDRAAEIANGLNYLGRIPLAGEKPAAEWEAFVASARQVPIDDFRAAAFDPHYRKAFMDAYRRIVIEGR